MSVFCVTHKRLKLCLLIISAVQFLIVSLVLNAQNRESWREEALVAAYGFDGVNGKNRDWEIFTHIFENNLEMVLVPPGSFYMGTSMQEVESVYQICLEMEETCNRQAYEIEMPLHHQVISQPYWIDRFEVTRQQYDNCVASGICTSSDVGEFSNLPDQPVNLVTWSQAVTYCQSWRSGRLPTEAEWEYAARGPSGWTFPWSNEMSGTNLNYCDMNCPHNWRANTNDGYEGTAPIGSYLLGQSWVGAYDMSGNLWEWVSTKFRVYPYEASDGREEVVGSSLRVIRGGSFNANQTMVRANARFWLDQEVPGRGVGFRCVRDFG